VEFPYQFFGSTYQPAGSVTVDGPTSFLFESNAYTLALVGLASITGSPEGTRTTFVRQPRKIGNTSSQIILERLWSLAVLDIGGWGCSDPVEECQDDLVDPVHSGFFSASLAR
jgi:hypothetical protein